MSDGPDLKDLRGLAERLMGQDHENKGPLSEEERTNLSYGVRGLIARYEEMQKLYHFRWHYTYSKPGEVLEIGFHNEEERAFVVQCITIGMKVPAALRPLFVDGDVACKLVIEGKA